MSRDKVRLSNPISAALLNQNVNGSVVKSEENDESISIQKVVLVDTNSNPVVDVNDANPLVVINPNNAKYDQTSGTATGSTATTATYKIVNQIVVTPIAIITAGACTLTVKGTTSGVVLAVITLPTIAVALTIPSAVFAPSVNLQAAGETVTLTIGANFTSGTVSVNVYGN